MSSVARAVILHHPRCPEPILEAPMRVIEAPTRESILRAWRESNAERQALQDQGVKIPALHPIPIDACAAILADHTAMRRRDAADALVLMVEEHGLKTIKALLRNIEHMEGGE